MYTHGEVLDLPVSRLLEFLADARAHGHALERHDYYFTSHFYQLTPLPPYPTVAP
jgi:hypothetical protein